MGFWSLLVGSLVKPQDPFPQRVRKGVVAIFFFPTVLVWLGYAANDMMIATNAWRYTAPIAMVLLSTISIISYFAMRKHKEVGDSHFSFVMWSLGILMFLIMLCHPEADNKTPICVWLGIAVQTGLPKIYWYFGFLFLLSLLPDWNTAFIREPDMQVLLPGSARNIDPYTLYVSRIIATLVYMLCCVVAKQQGDSAEKQRLAQAAANKMTLKILNHQKKYNTEGVHAILEECVAEKLVDPDLIQLFQEMNQNFESYRPFLPNYLFQDEEEEGEAPRVFLGGRPEEEGVELSTAESSNISYTDVDEMTLSEGSGSRSEGGVADDTTTATTEYSQGNDRNQLAPSVANPIDPVTIRRGTSALHFSHGPRPVSGQLRPMDQSTHFTAYVSMAVVDIQVDRLLAALNSCFGGGSGAQASPPATLMLKRRSTSSVSGGERTHPSANALGGGGGGSQLLLHQDKASTVKTLVNIIYSLANETKASVHSLVGDTVQLSWNATHMISLPETKGALFLARLRKLFATTRGGAKKPGQTETLCPTQAGIAGAVCSGEATVHSIISTTHQRSLVIDAPWLPALAGCFDLAKRHGAMLMDERTARGANLSVDGVVVEKIFYRNLPFCPEAEDEEEATSIRSFSGTLQQGGAPSSHHFLFHSPNRELRPEQNASPLPVPDPPAGAAAGTTSQPTSPSKIDRSVSGGSFGGGGGGESSSQNASIVFQILGEKTRQDNLEWMYQLDRSEVNPSRGLGSHTETSSQQPGGGVAQLQKDVVEAFADGRMADAARTLDYFEARKASFVSDSPPRFTSPTSTSADTTKPTFASMGMKSPPRTPLATRNNKSGNQNIIGFCLPTFRAAIILAVRSRAAGTTTSRASSQPSEAVSVGSGAAK